MYFKNEIVNLGIHDRDLLKKGNNKFDVIYTWCSSNEFGAYERYTKNGYFNDINTALRAGYTSDFCVIDDIKRLDKLFNTIPSSLKNNTQMIVYRGTILTSKLQAILDGSAQSDIYTDKAFLSTSKNKKIAKEFAQGDDKIIFEITIPAKSNVIDDSKLPSTYKSLMEAEEEVLLPRNSQLQITGYNPKTKVVTATYIGQAKPLETPVLHKYRGSDILSSQNKKLLIYENNKYPNKFDKINGLHMF